MSGAATLDAAGLASGKSHGDENFPVASHLVAPRYRAPIMAFYRFARGADDVADHPTASADSKLTMLEAMRRTIKGDANADAPSAALRDVMAERGLDPIHALDLLEAFMRDCTIDRYADWEALIDYCRYSAMPVGRFVLDVHGESRDLWPGNDALCAALQVINHLQDCGKDFRAIDRVYIPEDMLAKHGATVADLGGERATPGLQAAIAEAAEKTQALLVQSAGFARGIHDRRLGCEVAVIQRLAVSLAARLRSRDPLSQRVHHGKVETLMLALGAIVGRIAR
jgi:squalene synthase HpnC